MLKLYGTAEAVKLRREEEAEREVLFHLTASHRALLSALALGGLLCEHFQHSGAKRKEGMILNGKGLD